MFPFAHNDERLSFFNFPKAKTAYTIENRCFSLKRLLGHGRSNQRGPGLKGHKLRNNLRTHARNLPRASDWIVMPLDDGIRIHDKMIIDEISLISFQIAATLLSSDRYHVVCARGAHYRRRDTAIDHLAIDSVRDPPPWWSGEKNLYGKWF